MLITVPVFFAFYDLNVIEYLFDLMEMHDLLKINR